MRKSVIVCTISLLLFISHSFAAQDRHVYKIETNDSSGIRSISYMYPDLTCLGIPQHGFSDEKIEYYENEYVSIQINRHYSMTVIPLILRLKANISEQRNRKENKLLEKEINETRLKRKSMWYSVDACREILDIFKRSLNKAESLPMVLGEVGVDGKPYHKFSLIPIVPSSSFPKIQQTLILKTYCTPSEKTPGFIKALKQRGLDACGDDNYRKIYEFNPKEIEIIIKLLEALPHMKNMLKAYIKTQK